MRQDHLIGEAEAVVDVLAEEHLCAHLTRKSFGLNGQFLGAHGDDDLHSVLCRILDPLHGHLPAIAEDDARLLSRPLHRSAEEIGVPDEGRDKDVPRALVDGLRTRRLLDLALVHDSNAVGDRECLLLIMGDIDRRDADLFLYRADRGPHLHAQLCIEIGKRFIHEQYARMDDDGTSKCNALLLTARETFGKAILIVRDLYHVEDFIDALLHLRLWHLTQL